MTSVFSAGQRTIHAETHHQQGRQRCFYHLRRLRQIRNCVSQDVMAQHFISRLVYCKSVFSSLHAFSLAPLERVQNAAARLVLHLDRQSPVTSALQQLHRLPVKFRIIFKNATLMQQILHNRCPSYLTDLVEFNSADSQRRPDERANEGSVRHSRCGRLSSSDPAGSS